MDKSWSSVVKNFNPKKNFWRQQWKDIITISHKLAKKSGGGGGRMFLSAMDHGFYNKVFMSFAFYRD